MTRNIVKTTSCHDVGVDIDRIYRIGDAHDVICGQDISDVTRIALRTIADKYFVAVELDASWNKIVSDDGIDQEIVALLRTVPAESLGVSIFINSTMHGADGSRR